MPLNVLIVDDSSVMRAMIIKTIRMSGLDLGDVYQAGNGKEGLDAARENWVDLVVADINMPIMNGEEMIDQMKADPELSALPTIVISTEGSATRIQRLEKKGVTFIHKPFTPEIIRDAIQDLTGITGIGDSDESGAF
ncbi:MAG: response regulator [Desulfobacteraceae bacterium]|nr:response regulator [Desulfobacteraceae bacterium]MBC2752858.1 response regulator [Desulfobacteraceae bacterium]